MLSFVNFCHSGGIPRLLRFALVLSQVIHAADYQTFCNGNIYGSPVSPQCFSNLGRLHIQDTAVHYFVEQQMRSAPPEAVWNGFTDPRPPGEKQTIVQLPKWISSGQSILSARRFFGLSILLLMAGCRHV